MAKVAADIGGTFTDVVLEDGGRRFSTKVLTTYGDPANAVLAGLREVLGQAGCGPDAVELFLHGTTLATNAIIERRGARTALLTTEGHRDAVEMAFENRFEQYDVNMDRSQPLVPRPLRIPVRERIAADGAVLQPLDEGSLDEAVEALVAAGAESVAIGFLHAYRNPAHERAAAALVRERVPGAAVTLSSEVCPEMREYERLSTTCANAYVQPMMAAYLASLELQMRQAGVSGPMLLMTSGGGLTDIRTAARFPIRLVESGPAGGVLLAQRVARACGHARALSFDMGGTTAKICLLDDGEPLLSRAFEVDRAYRFKKGSGLPLRIPVLEMVEIGAGGGSIAEVDKLGRIQVGPASAGSAPGPAAYGQGGILPTVTDADALLGKLQGEFFAGGAMPLDLCASRSAMQAAVAQPLGMDAPAAAIGVTEVIDENMASAAHAHAIEWGKDAGGRTLIAYGGAAPLHACQLARKLKIDRILVPQDAGVGSAVGFLLAPVSFEVVRSRYMLLSALRVAEVFALLEEMRAEAAAVVSAATDAPLRETCRVYMRYVGQGYEIAVAPPLRPEVVASRSPEELSDDEADAGVAGRPGGHPEADPGSANPPGAPDAQPGSWPVGADAAFAEALGDAFAAAYQELYGRAIPGQEVEILSWTLALGTAPAATQAIPPAQRRRRVPAERTVQVFDASPTKGVDAALHRREALEPGDCLDGPALIVEAQTTTVVTADFSATVHAQGHLILHRRHPGGDGASLPAGPSVHSRSPPSMPENSALVRTQLVWNRLLAIVEEQAQTLMRTAFSTVVREAGDLSAGLFNTNGAMLAQAVTGTPGHVNAMAASMGKFLRRCPLDTLQPGDVLLTNDPWDATGHLNDFTVVTPIFRKGAPIALFASTSHIADVGGRGFGPDAAEVFEEGLTIPIGYLFRAGALNEVLMSIMEANVRDPVVAQGDLYALAACNEAGGLRLLETLEDFGLTTLDPTGDEILKASELAMCKEIAVLPDGRYSYAMRVDGYDEAVDLKATLCIRGEAMHIDFSGSSGPSRFGINVPMPYTEAYASFGVRCVVGNDIPNNAGSLGCIEVRAPSGCILNAMRPAAVSARHAIGQMLPDVVLGCLEQVLPGKTPAEGASCIWNPVFLGAGALGGSPGEDFVINPIFNGGAGARPTKDGLSTTAFPSGVRTTPTEVNEATSPLVIWRKEYRPASGGAGAFRGGHGQTIEIAHREGAPFYISKMFDRIGFPARGRNGGGAGAPGRVYLKDGPDMPGKGKDLVPAGATLMLETPGGGGMGDPAKRDKAAVQADAEAGLA